MAIKILIIEDSLEDASKAIESLHESGESFTYERVCRLSEALYELKTAPPNTYQKILLDSALPDIKGAVQTACDRLAKYVGSENIVLISSTPKDSTSKSISSTGVQVLSKDRALNDQGALASLFFEYQMRSHEKSVIRHREFSKLEADVRINRERIELLLEQNRAADERLSRVVEKLGAKIEDLGDRLSQLEVTATRQHKWYETRTALIAALIGTIGTVTAALVPLLTARK